MLRAMSNPAHIQDNLQAIAASNQYQQQHQQHLHQLHQQHQQQTADAARGTPLRQPAAPAAQPCPALLALLRFAFAACGFSGSG